MSQHDGHRQNLNASAISHDQHETKRRKYSSARFREGTWWKLAHASPHARSLYQVLQQNISKTLRASQRTGQGYALPVRFSGPEEFYSLLVSEVIIHLIVCMFPHEWRFLIFASKSFTES